MKRWVYAEMSRALSDEEHSALFAAVDALIAESGYVGVDKGPTDEVGFTVEAQTDEEAREMAVLYMDRVLAAAALSLSYTLQIGARRT